MLYKYIIIYIINYWSLVLCCLSGDGAAALFLFSLILVGKLTPCLGCHALSVLNWSNRCVCFFPDGY